MRNSLTSSLLLMFCLALSGCGGASNVKVSGKLTYKEKPLNVGQGGVTVIFIPVAQKGQAHDTYPADYEPKDGSFHVPGKDGNGIPAGKYRISVQQMTFNPSAETAKMNEKFGADNSPIVRDVTGAEPVNIELAQFLGK